MGLSEKTEEALEDWLRKEYGDQNWLWVKGFRKGYLTEARKMANMIIDGLHENKPYAQYLYDNLDDKSVFDMAVKDYVDLG